MGTRRLLALGGLIGPAAFIGAWVGGAAITSRDYSSIDDAISRLAAVGNNSRHVMNAGFVGFGVALAMYAAALRQAVRGPAWISAAATGVATLLVAATPLEGSPTIDTWHGFFAGVGYITLAATPLVAARPLARQGHRALSRAGMLAGLISVSSLLLTTTSLPTGVFQRIGLTTTDLWIALSAVAIVTNRISLVRA